MAWSERQLKVPGVLVAMILAATGCPTPQFVGAQEQAFHPASHDVGVDLAAIAAVGLRGGYRQFDRAAIVAAIQSNDVYGPVIAGMRNQVEQLVQMSDDELRSLIPAASTIRGTSICSTSARGRPTAPITPHGKWRMASRSGPPSCLPKVSNSISRAVSPDHPVRNRRPCLSWCGAGHLLLTRPCRSSPPS